MSKIVSDYDKKYSQPSLTITRDIFAALSPLDQIAARALERCGLLRIVDEQPKISAR